MLTNSKKCSHHFFLCRKKKFVCSLCFWEVKSASPSLLWMRDGKVLKSGNTIIGMLSDGWEELRKLCTTSQETKRPLPFVHRDISVQLGCPRASPLETLGFWLLLCCLRVTLKMTQLSLDLSCPFAKNKKPKQRIQPHRTIVRFEKTWTVVGGICTVG